MTGTQRIISFYRIITESFYSKADLEQWLMPGIEKDDYRLMMEILWGPLVEKNLSFAVKSARDGRTIGVGLNFDLWDEPELILDSKLTIVFDFLEFLEAPIRERKLPKGKGQIVHNFMMSTSSDLNPAENVIMMKEMEVYCLQLAKRKEYAGIFTTNTSPLTQVTIPSPKLSIRNAIIVIHLPFAAAPEIRLILQFLRKCTVETFLTRSLRSGNCSIRATSSRIGYENWTTRGTAAESLPLRLLLVLCRTSHELFNPSRTAQREIVKRISLLGNRTGPDK